MIINKILEGWGGDGVAVPCSTLEKGYFQAWQ